VSICDGFGMNLVYGCFVCDHDLRLTVGTYIGNN